MVTESMKLDGFQTGKSEERVMGNRKPIILVAGARPNFMKIAPLYHELAKRGANQILLHTGQHYDDKMSGVFFDDLGLPDPDIYLGVGSGTHSVQTAKVMIEFEKVCLEEDPALVVVVGDVNSTIGCALVAVKLGIKSAHLEAGLRSFDRKMPEEINRILTDSISDILLTPSIDANHNLLKEGRCEEDIHFVGNIMIDSLMKNLERSSDSDVKNMIGISDQNYGLLTLHRPSNVDDARTLKGIITAIEHIAKNIKIIFPVHPRTQKNLEAFGLSDRMMHHENIICTGPLGYLDFISLMSKSIIVLTDSGGLQEETTFLGIPCLTLRESTERPVTVTEGTNIIVGSQTEEIIRAYDMKVHQNPAINKNPPKYWDGTTAVRIADIILQEV